jgi:hypothetical protein
MPVVPGKTAADKAADQVVMDNAKATADAARQLPDTLAAVANSIKLINDLQNSPDLDKLVGNTLGQLRKLRPGTVEANLQARLNQIQGGTFMQAYQNLKGSGAITEVEGAKAESALTRMSSNQSPEEFKQAANEYIEVMQAGMKRAKQKAGVPVEDMPPPPKPTDSSSAPVWTPALQAELDAYHARFGKQK